MTGLEQAVAGMDINKSDNIDAVEQKITPWEVEGAVVDGEQMAVDYEKLTKNFGTKLIDPALLERFEKLTGHKPHMFLRRGIFFSHRDLEVILDRYEQKKPFYLYTGRGPSKGRMHLGHMLPFVFTKWLQDVFDVPLVIQLTAAIGYKPEKTLIFSDLDFMGGQFYRNIVKISKSITGSTAKAAFGFTDTDCVGKVFYPCIQIAPAFSTSFPGIFGENSKPIPCLIPCGIDQDPYFRLTRDIALKLKHPKPSLIHSIFLPALQGPNSKMSSSIDASAIFTSDTAAQVKNKINRNAFSGGRETLELHKKYGGNPDVDVPYQYLRYFSDDDELLDDLAAKYRSGELLSSEMKQHCIKAIQDFLAEFQANEKAVTDEMVKNFMDPYYPRKFDILQPSSK
ncbi:Tryptophan-tRNA ligase, cytoplasmic [Zancudomyces culisetae]|uniref:tryptophan--tRNA ligase n=1 Tax=Zancudomyces culisetae TaxID=1213189 RepID=A0A1R1PVL0_ZANCU|nr:Tryptophan-tRNA ligase, cytoplasmic [Zancudomyces culisetae]OMH85005.1 Tryptophan-tRNA ligase, cytoplasmic [Zancudomyces culisetae]|eukprot:OMH83628.1 Tryptophan-tRNA ligase, cytoplasmic [Zancudomyces culisetae]